MGKPKTGRPGGTSTSTDAERAANDTELTELTELRVEVAELRTDLANHRADIEMRTASHSRWLSQLASDQRTNSEHITRMAQQIERVRRRVARPLGLARKAKRTVDRRRSPSTPGTGGAGPGTNGAARPAGPHSREAGEVAAPQDGGEPTTAERLRRRELVRQFVVDSATGPDGEAAVEMSAKAVSGSPITIASSDEPVVSIIIPVFNAIDDTLRCLESLAGLDAGVAIEVIVANDGSTEGEATDAGELGFALVRLVDGITIIDNPENLGFLRNCNNAAGHARGDYLWFLNSDTIVAPDALAALVDTFACFDQVGIVGSKLVYPDGVLQEAGGIVWRDGSAWNLGRGEDPEAAEFNYARVADYVSGASLLVRRELFESLGRFDEAFAPAYYEDTDLCLQARQAGYSVVYQPASVVVHAEGASYETGHSQGIPEHLREKRDIFAAKWVDALAGHRANGDRPDLEKERSVALRTLVVDARMLTPDQDSGSLRMTNTLAALRSVGHKVTFVPQNLLPQEPYLSRMQAVGIEVITRPAIRSVTEFLEQRGAEFDVVMLSRLEVAEPLIEPVRAACPDATVVFDTVDLHFLRQAREFHVTGTIEGGFDHNETLDAELAVIAAADISLVCSSVEAELLAGLVPDARVEILSNVHEADPTESPADGRAGLLFVGGFEHPPNHDAVVWFVEDILPKIHAAVPGVPLHVVGSKAPPEIHDLAGEFVHVHGFVEDLDPLYESCRVSIAPLRYGAGVKGKVTQALSRGLPCVGTTMALEGTPLVAGEHLLVAADADEFAQQVITLLRDDDRWNSVARAGLQAIDSWFSLAFTAESLRVVLGPFAENEVLAEHVIEEQRT